MAKSVILCMQCCKRPIKSTTYSYMLHSSRNVDNSSSNLKIYYHQKYVCVVPHSFKREKLKMDASSNCWSSIKSLAWVWSDFSSLSNSVNISRAFCCGRSCLRHMLELKRALREVKISPNRDRSWEMRSPLACIRGPIRCLPRATRFFKLDHLLWWHHTHRILVRACTSYH